MKAVGIKVLKNKLSEYVRMAASGETILVTDRDLVVAELVAPGYGRKASVKENLWEDAIRRGLIRPALNRREPILWPKPIQSLEQTLRELDQDRSDR